MPLVLNTHTANISLQFHCTYDNEFSTCKRNVKFTSEWQYRAKLQEHNNAQMKHDFVMTLPTQHKVQEVQAKKFEPHPLLIQPWTQDVLQDSQPSDTGAQTLGNAPVDGTNEGAIDKVMQQEPLQQGVQEVIKRNWEMHQLLNPLLLQGLEG